jgi:hypothetical protein
MPRRRTGNGGVAPPFLGSIKMDLKKRSVGVEWIHLARDRVQWWVRLNTVMSLRVLQNGEDRTLWTSGY